MRKKLIRRFNPGGTFPIYTQASIKQGQINSCNFSTGQCAKQVGDLQQANGVTPSRANSWDQFRTALNNKHVPVNVEAMLKAIAEQDLPTLQSYRGSVFTAGREGGQGNPEANDGWDEDHTVMVTGLVRGNDGFVRPLLYSGYQDKNGKAVYTNEVLDHLGTFGSNAGDTSGTGRYTIQRGYHIAGSNKEYKGFNFETERQVAQKEEARQAALDRNEEYNAAMSYEAEKIRLRKKEKDTPGVNYLDLAGLMNTKDKQAPREYYNKHIWNDHFKPYDYNK